MKWDEELTWSSQLEVEEVKCTFPELSPLPLLWGCCWYVRSEQQRWRVVGLVWTHHVLCWLCILVFGGVCQCGLLSLPLPGRISLRMIAERRENGEFGRKKPACDSQLRLWTWHLLLMFANVKTFVLSGFTAAALEHPDTRSQALTGWRGLTHWAAVTISCGWNDRRTWCVLTVQSPSQVVESDLLGSVQLGNAAAPPLTHTNGFMLAAPLSPAPLSLPQCDKGSFAK